MNAVIAIGAVQGVIGSGADDLVVGEGGVDLERQILAGTQTLRVSRGDFQVQVAHIAIARRTGKRAGGGVEGQPIR